MTSLAPGRSTTPLTRVALFWSGYLAILVFTGMFRGMLVPQRWGDFAWGIGSSALLIVLTLAMERRSGPSGRSSVSFDEATLVRFALGAAIGLCVVAVNLAVVRLAIGPIRILRDPALARPFTTLALMAAGFLALSAMEELGFRGYTIRSLVQTIGPWRAQLVVAVAFGLSHLAYGWPLQAILLGVIPSAVLFGVAALVSGGLAMPIGLHAAINLALWSVGAKGGGGLWIVDVPADLQARLAAISPILGLAGVLAWTGILWRFRRLLRLGVPADTFSGARP